MGTEVQCWEQMSQVLVLVQVASLKGKISLGHTYFKTNERK